MIESPSQPRPTAAPAPRLRIALAHDWLCGFRGGEAVLELIASLVEPEFEPAGLYTMFDDGWPLSPAVDRWRSLAPISAWPLGRRPSALRMRRWLFPLYPRAVANLS